MPTQESSIQFLSIRGSGFEHLIRSLRVSTMLHSDTNHLYQIPRDLETRLSDQMHCDLILREPEM